MADTLRESLRSIAGQITQEFEIVFVDDGSSDESVQIALDLQAEFPNMRVVALDRDPSRKLGYTRNESFRLARGEWCIFHLDCDDTVGPFIIDFVRLVTNLDKGFDRHMLYAGQQIHMAKRSFLLRHGPFQNIYRGEDRDFYMRLVSSSSWIVIKHLRFIKRIPRTKQKMLLKNYLDVLDQMTTDLAENSSYRAYIGASFESRKIIGSKTLLLRVLLAPMVRRKARNRTPISRKGYPTHSEFVKYRTKNTKSASEWLETVGENTQLGIDRRIFF
jgi:glycosyltransferase involved in cell wall biosynthesis